ncbi:T9SS type A sorting domain-containing protein [bacterium]|nr:T9SS type A sorting domain-containing protein [bacterium]
MRLKTSILMLFSLWVCISSAETMLSAIDAEYRAGQITLDEAMLFKAYSVFDHEKLPPRFRSLEPPRCGTPAIVEIRRNWDELSQSTQNALARIMARPTGLPLTYNTTHFKMHYTLTGSDAVPNESYVHTMADKFEDAYTFETVTLGYYTPPSDGTAGGDSRYDVYIFSLSPGVMGYTSPEVAGPQPWNDATSYIAMRNNYTGYGPTTEMIEVTSVHEFFHAVQFAYDYSEQPWYMEVSSVWIEDEMYPTYDEEQYYLPVFFNNPEVSITTYDGSHEYGSYHWNTYLSETYGDSIVKMIWLENRYSSCISSFQTVLSSFGTTRSAAFGEFFAWNYFTGSRNLPGLYPEGADYPLIHIERTHTTYPANGSSTHNPENFASNYIVFNIPGGASGPFTVTFDGEDGRSWWAQVIIPGATTYTSHHIPLNSYNYGVVSIDSAEWAGHSSIILVVGNISTSGGAATYSYHADFEEVGPSYNPPRNLTAESGHSGSVPLDWDPPIGGGTSGTEELYYDDGTPSPYYIPRDLGEIGYPEYGNIIYEGVKFNATSDCTLKQVIVYFAGTGANVEFKVSQDNSGVPGTDLTGSPFNAPVSTSGWDTITVPGGGIPVPAGDFWVGYTRTSDDLYCTFDAETTLGMPSLFISDSGYAFNNTGGDYLLRAVITTGSGGGITVTGYKIYRGTTPGGPYSYIGTSGTESYSDGSVTDGTSYYYVVTATYSDAGESGYSNEAMAVPGTGSGTGGDTLRHDDGSAEYILTGTSLGEKYAVVFEPTGPCQLLSVRYFVDGTPYLNYFQVGIHRWTGTRITGNYIEPFPYWVDPDANGWTNVDLSPYEIYIPGDFAVAYIVNDTSTHIGIDDIDDDYSWVYDPSSDNWYDLSYTLFIQAVVRYLETGETHTLYGTVNLSAGSGGSPPPSDLSGSIVRVVETGDLDTTDTSGYYEVDSLPAGVYTVEAWHPGYESQQQTIGMTDDVEQNFSLVPFNTPLNPLRAFSATNYLDGAVLLRWMPPLGFPGTVEEISYYDRSATSLWFYPDLGRGDIFDTRFEIWFPCTVQTIAFECYDSTGGYPDVSVHFWLDDGEGYPDLENELIDSVIISPTGYPSWDTLNMEGSGLVLWPGQVLHMGVRLLASQPSILSTDTLPHYSPPLCRLYSESAGSWQNLGELMVAMIVKYFAGTARLSPVANPPEVAKFYASMENVAPAIKLTDHPLRRAMSPMAAEGLQEYLIYRADSRSGPYSLVGTVDDVDSMYFIDSTVTNENIYYYYGVASYDHGYSDPSDTVAAFPLAFNDTAWVLFVDDDASCYNSGFDDEGIAIAQILLDIGVPFNAIDLDPLYYISDDALSGYQAVIWNCGAVFSNGWTLADSEEANIGRYLDSGGKFALFAQDYLWDIYAGASVFSTGTFVYDYLGLGSATQDYWTITGTSTGTLEGYGFADGLSYSVENPFENGNLYWDKFNVFSGDTLLYFDYGDSSGIIGTQYDGDGFKSVFVASSPFAMVDGTAPNTVEEFFRRMLYDYFDVHSAPSSDTVVVTYNLSAGWHMLSVPVQMSDNSAASVFPGNYGVYTYDPTAGSYVAVSTAEPGIGYFVLFLTDVTFDLTGEPVETLNVDFNGGWNMIGVPWTASGTISFSEASYEPDMLLPGTYYGYDASAASYFIPSTAEVKSGYWVALLGDCTLHFPGSSLMKSSVPEMTSDAYKLISEGPPPPPSKAIPKGIEISSPKPNPFNSSCEIDIYLPDEEKIYVEVRDILGRTISLEERILSGGRHSIKWDGKNISGAAVPSGIYFISVKCGGRNITKDVLLIR